MLVSMYVATALVFYPVRFSVTDKLLLNGPAHLILGITDANRICLLREQIIYRLLLKMWLVLILFSTLHTQQHQQSDYIGFLLHIADCDSGTASIPESGAVAGAVAKAWCHFLKSSYAFHTAEPVKRRQ